jgi:4'-phosphopantetheinyl transferase
VTHVWAIRLDVRARVVALARALLHDDERERARRLVTPTLGDRFIVGRGALRLLLGFYVGAAPTALIFRVGAHGKPFLAEPFDDLVFNVAHSGDLALIAVTRCVAVGVDVERVRPVDNAAVLARSYFSADEAEAISTLGQVEQSEAFLRCWTRKEAVTKTTGDGLTRSLASFGVPLERDMAPYTVAPLEPSRSGALRLFSLEPAPGYVGAVAVEGEPDEIVSFVLADDLPTLAG